MRTVNFTQRYSLFEFSGASPYPFSDYDLYIDYIAGVNAGKSGFNVYQPGYPSPITTFQPASGYIVIKTPGLSFSMVLPDVSKPDVLKFKRRYNIFTYPYSIPLDFSKYGDYIETVLITNPSGTGFISYSPGYTAPFTAFQPGSSYLLVAYGDFDMENPEPTPTPTSTPEPTPNQTPTQTPTTTSRATPTPTPTPGETPVATPQTTSTATPSVTPSMTGSPGATPATTSTPTPTPTGTPVQTSTPTQTRTPTNTATAAPANTPTPTRTATPTTTTTLTMTPTPSVTMTKTPTMTPSVTPTGTPASTPASTVTPTTTTTLTQTPTRTPASTVTPTPTTTITLTRSPTPTMTPTPTLFPVPVHYYRIDLNIFNNNNNPSLASSYINTDASFLTISDYVINSAAKTMYITKNISSYVFNASQGVNIVRGNSPQGTIAHILNIGATYLTNTTLIQPNINNSQIIFNGAPTGPGQYAFSSSNSSNLVITTSTPIGFQNFYYTSGGIIGSQNILATLMRFNPMEANLTYSHVPLDFEMTDYAADAGTNKSGTINFIGTGTMSQFYFRYSGVSPRTVLFGSNVTVNGRSLSFQTTSSIYGLNTATVDSLLQAIARSVSINGTIRINGSGAGFPYGENRSSASNAAVATIKAAGCSLYILGVLQ